MRWDFKEYLKGFGDKRIFEGDQIRGDDWRGSIAHARKGVRNKKIRLPDGDLVEVGGRAREVWIGSGF